MNFYTGSVSNTSFRHIRPVGLLFLLLFFSQNLFGQTASNADRFVSDYLRLRNLDPSGYRQEYVSDWRRLAKRASGAIDGSASDDAQVFASQVELQLYRLDREPSRLQRVSSYLSGYPLSVLRPRFRFSQLQLLGFALSGDLYLYQGREREASEVFRRLLTMNGRPDFVRKIRSRLQGVLNGTFRRFMPSDLLVVPKLLDPSALLIDRPRTKMVVLDPGHGGEDSGASSHAYNEKTLTLDLAKRVKAELELFGGYSVYITRETDAFMPLDRRTALANLKQADAFVSLHANASERHNQRGFEAYYLDNTDNASSQRLARRENGLMAGESADDLSFILSDLIQNGKIEDSILLAHAIDASVRQGVITKYSELRSRGIKKAPFYVLVGAHMPCVLLETFFIDHPIEGQLLGRNQFRSELARSVANGIRSFFEGR